MIEFNEDGSLKVPKEFKKKIEIVGRKDQEKNQLKDKFFRNSVFDFYKKRCYICSSRYRLQLHHESYEWVCAYKFLEEKPSCENCFMEKEEAFNKCISVVKPLCYGCHKKVHKILKRDTGEWIGNSSVNMREVYAEVKEWVDRERKQKKFYSDYKRD